MKLCLHNSLILSSSALFSTDVTFTEERISDLLRNKDKAAISLVFDHYGLLLLNSIKRILRDDAISEDVLQTVLLKVWQKGHNFDSSKGSLFTWLMKISRNAAIDKTRSRDYKLLQASEQDVEVLSISEDVASENRFDNMWTKQLVDHLPENQRVLINMSFFEGYSHQEICDKMNIPLGTVKTRIRLAIKHLRSVI